MPLMMKGLPARRASEVTPRPPCKMTASTRGKSAPKSAPSFQTKSRPSACRSATRAFSASSGPWPSMSCPLTRAMNAGRRGRATPGRAEGRQCSQTATAACNIFVSPTGIDENVMATTCRPSRPAFSRKASICSGSTSPRRRRKMKPVRVMPSSVILLASSSPKTFLLMGTICGIFCLVSSLYCQKSIVGPWGIGPSLRDNLR
mmetsp:Transcript_147893/g.375908  ORF Transcript_147893/g.375908 Transcript_147893/m.375908 type:complete len:203 (-) Transcript_147893:177-785(-)